MKINGIKPYLAQMISSDKSSINTKHQYRPDYAEEVVERDERYIIDHYLYTAEQMQEYAKAKVKELLFEQLWNDRFYANSKIFFDKEVEKICSSIFEEDTKND